jgi:hypothetical protein
MVKNLSVDDIHLFITVDFMGAWNSLAANPDKKIGRGNFMFGRQAMNLLEFAARLCTNDATGKALRDFSNELFKIDPRYFTQLPSPCASNADFVLPHVRSTTENLLLWALFDLIRNGLAHQYQQLSVNLTDGKNFFITLTGADYGRFLNLSRIPQKSSSHLKFDVDADGDLGLLVCPDILFLDFEDAITNSGLLRRNLSFPYLTRSFRKKTSYYNFNLTSLENSLVTGGHSRV